MASDAPKALNRLGQSLWLDNITRDLLDDGTLKRYIDELSVTGLTSNPTIFDHAISRSSRYDAEIRRQIDRGATGEDLFLNLAIQDLSRAADLFAAVHARTGTVDGFVSLEVSPLLAYDTQATVAQAKALHAQANKPNLFIKIPGTTEGRWVSPSQAVSRGAATNKAAPRPTLSPCACTAGPTAGSIRADRRPLDRAVLPGARGSPTMIPVVHDDAFRHLFVSKPGTTDLH